MTILSCSQSDSQTLSTVHSVAPRVEGLGTRLSRSKLSRNSHVTLEKDKGLLIDKMSCMLTAFPKSGQCLSTHGMTHTPVHDQWRVNITVSLLTSCFQTDWSNLTFNPCMKPVTHACLTPTPTLTPTHMHTHTHTHTHTFVGCYP